ncbi:Uncharacterised protein [Leminorella richardii]|uniref:Uncharacterized protein n=1 Tax=Leminorella richardii TaxID=158841 RepID=A0A2X4XP14_9GAMM|nr:Uncharacterised protein [Leminorella richardii]
MTIPMWLNTVENKGECVLLPVSDANVGLNAVAKRYCYLFG